jgi:hypothetical protein
LREPKKKKKQSVDEMKERLLSFARVHNKQQKKKKVDNKRLPASYTKMKEGRKDGK